MSREAGSKVIDGKVVMPDLPELSSPNSEAVVNALQDGRLSIAQTFDGVRVTVMPAMVLNKNMKPEALLQAFNKLNQWVTIHSISPEGGRCTISPPKKADPAQEFTAVRLMEGTCYVKFGGNDARSD